MTTFKTIKWFRLFVIVAISFLASMMFNLGDEVLSNIEILRTATQALIAGFAFLQCPEDAPKKRGEIK